MNQQSCSGAGKLHVLGLPAQRESGGDSRLEPERCLEEGDRFWFQEASSTALANPPGLYRRGCRWHSGGVCTSACYVDEGLAGIYCVSTIPEERGKGLGAHATAEPLRLAARAGYRVGILQSSEAGHSLYKSLGFADFGGVPLYVRIPA